VVHDPRPGSFDYPSLGERLELSFLGALHDFCCDVKRFGMPLEGFLESSVGPELCQGRSPGLDLVEEFDAASVIGGGGGDDAEAEYEPQSVDDSEVLSARDLLSSVVSPGRRGDRGCSAYCSGCVTNAEGGVM
jgi:hypothetical protein